MDLYVLDGWWEGWVKITRDEEIVISFDTGAVECTVLIEGTSDYDEKAPRGVYPVR